MAANPPSTATAPARVAMLAGGSGRTGSALLRLVLNDDAFGRVLAVSRRPLQLEHPRLANRIVPFDRLAERLKGTRCTDAFCALGAAGGPRASAAALRAVDVELVVEFARAALAAGASRLVVISAAGASQPAAHVFQRAKADMEAGVASLGFAAVDVIQPRLIYGARTGDGPLELLRLAVVRTTAPLLRSSKLLADAWPAEVVARAMHRAAHSGRRGQTFWTGPALARLAVQTRTY